MSLKILHVVDYLMPGMGYQENFLPKWNAKQQHKVTIITGDRYQPIDDYEKSWGKVLGPRFCRSGVFVEDGIKVIRLKVSFEIKKRPWFKNLSSTITKNLPDVILVHGTTNFNFYRVGLIAKKLKIPCLADNHMVFHAIQKGFLSYVHINIHRVVLKVFYEKIFYKFIGVTNETCDYLKKYEHVKNKNITLLPLGVDDSIFYSYSKRKFDNIQEVIIIQTGKLGYDKKPQWLADAVVKLLNDSYKIKCKFIGGGSTKIKNYIIDKFKNNGHENQLEFTSFVRANELTEIYNNADICVYPDGTSLSALEAAACGAVVIMADYSASNHRAQQGLGVTYKTGDIGDLSLKIKKIIDNDEYREKVVENSLLAIKKYYSYDQISKEFVNLCQEAITQKN